MIHWATRLVSHQNISVLSSTNLKCCDWTHSHYYWCHAEPKHQGLCCSAKPLILSITLFAATPVRSLIFYHVERVSKIPLGIRKVKVFSSRFGCQEGWSLQTWKAWGTSWWYKACVILDLPPSVCTTKSLLHTLPNAVAVALSPPKAPALITYMVCQLYARCFVLFVLFVLLLLYTACKID